MKKTAIIIASFFFLILLTTAVVYAALTWSETQPAGNTVQSWTPSAMSSDGQKMIVGVQSGGLYISSNKGSSWTLIDPTGGIENPDWLTTSMSPNGQIILAGVYGGRLYRSTNGGSIWSEIRPGGDADFNWATTSMSSDGQIMVAGVKTDTTGKLYKSTNGGTNWSEVQPAGSSGYAWNVTSMSSNGQVMVAAIYNGLIYKSTDGGNIWTEIQPAGSDPQGWSTSGMSSSGQTILVGNGDSLFLSTNYGSNWIEVFPDGEVDKGWSISSVSGNGQTLFTGGTDRLYLSINGGTSWSETQPVGNVDRNWVLGSMSSDTQALLAGVYDGRLYVGLNPLPTSTPSSGGGSSAPSTGPFSCTDSMPSGTPDLFQITTTKTTATLYFSPAANSNGYYIGYGTGQNTGEYGVQTNFGDVSGVLSYTINLLSPNTTYSFIIRGQNGCMPGNWGNTMTVKTTTGGTMTYYKNFASQVLNMIPQSTTVLGTSSKKKTITTPHPTPVEKTVLLKPTASSKTPSIAAKKKCFLFLCL